jgi:ectoine hydroxylase-related dioxygenase (phytanoyl-CoA dioxygenase family)
MATVPRFHYQSADWPRFYSENGFCVLAGIWQPGECDALVACAHQLPKAQAGDYKPVLQPQEQAPEFLSAMRKPNLTHIVEDLVGGTASGLQIEFFFGHPGTTGFTPHQDNFFVQGGPGTFLSTWTGLTDIDADMGVLYVFPGSHRFGLLPVRDASVTASTHQDPNAVARASVLPGAIAEPIPLTVSKGETVLLEGNTVHGSKDNSSDRFRYALLCTYIRKGAPFRAGFSAKRTPIELHP